MSKTPLRPPTHPRWAQRAIRRSAAGTPHAGPAPGSTRRRTLLTLLTLLVGLTLVGAATFGLLSHAGRPSPAFTAADAGRLPASDGPPATTQHLSPPTSPGQGGAAPIRLLAAGVHLAAPVVPVGVTAGALDVPDDVHTLGWWQGGTAAGSNQGTVVIDGHVDSAGQGIGALASIARMQPGDRLTLRTARNQVDYVVQARRSYPKDDLPTGLFTRTGPSRFALITCGGPFIITTRHYRDNIVVYATPAPPIR